MILPVPILYEDDIILALNKPTGLLTEGGGDHEDDLEQQAQRFTRKATYCCHRLDRLTSGVVLFRKGGRYKAELSALFESRQIRKIYWALVEGEWDPRIRSIQTQIAPVRKGVFANVDQEGKAAHSTFQILGKSSDRSITWLSVWLKTGRTHQARLHCLKGGSPVIGDTLYGARETTGLFGLHARELQFVHPATQNMVKLSAPAPSAWEAMLEKLAS